jgi:beta-glucosidase
MEWVVNMKKLLFPPGFVWGAATASYQIEGAAFEDGKGESIWDRFSHAPGNIANADTGDVACDHYHRYKEDIVLMRELGLKSYRLSLSWPRIVPNGKGRINENGMDFYLRLCEELVEAGVEPAVTLYHWDLPQCLMDIGGWAHRDTVKYYADYAALAFERLNPYVKRWFTLNEPNVVAYMGYMDGWHAPGVRDPRVANQVAHHLLLGHGLAYQAFLDGNYHGEIGIVVDVWPCYPSVVDDPEEKAMADQLNKWNLGLFLDPIFKGVYTEGVWDYKAGSVGFEPNIGPDDMRIIHKPVNFIGLNNYSSHFVGNKARQVEAEFPVTQMGWIIVPEGIYDLSSMTAREYGVPIYITENGAAYPDEPSADGEVKDPLRIEYIHKHLKQIHRAISDGVDIRGYYCWSLMDNFEWAYGFEKRFGLIYIDYNKLQRVPKQSYKWYQQVIKDNAI